MIVQMALLSKAVSPVFLAHAGLGQVALLLLLLLGVIVVRAGLVWGREVAAQQGAIRVKSDLRERLFARLLQLGPAYSRGERTGELVATLSEGIERLDAYVSRYIPQQEVGRVWTHQRSYHAYSLPSRSPFIISFRSSRWGWPCSS